MSASDRRQQLVDIGLVLLESRPIQELTLDEVAAEAGVSRTLVFHYFPSKGDYFAAVVSSAGDRLMQDVPTGPGEDVDTRLSHMVEDFLRFVQRKRGVYVALVRGASGGDPKVLAGLDEVRAGHVIRWLDAAQWPARDEVTQLALRGWLGSLEEVALAATNSPVPRATVVQLLVDGLLADLTRAGLLAGSPTDPQAERPGSLAAGQRAERRDDPGAERPGSLAAAHRADGRDDRIASMSAEGSAGRRADPVGHA